MIEEPTNRELQEAIDALIKYLGVYSSDSKTADKLDKLLEIQLLRMWPAGMPMYVHGEDKLSLYDLKEAWKKEHGIK